MISISSFMMAHVSDSDDIVAKLLTKSFSRLSYNDKLEWQRISCMTPPSSGSEGLGIKVTARHCPIV